MLTGEIRFCARFTENRIRRSTTGAGAATPTDTEVTASFTRSVLPGGFVYEYLRAGQLAVLLGDTLFVHGGLEGKGAEAKARCCAPTLWVVAMDGC